MHLTSLISYYGDLNQLSSASLTNKFLLSNKIWSIFPTQQNLVISLLFVRPDIFSKINVWTFDNYWEKNFYFYTSLKKLLWMTKIRMSFSFSLQRITKNMIHRVLRNTQNTLNLRYCKYIKNFLFNINKLVNEVSICY